MAACALCFEAEKQSTRGDGAACWVPTIACSVHVPWFGRYEGLLERVESDPCVSLPGQTNIAADVGGGALVAGD